MKGRMSVLSSTGLHQEVFQAVSQRGKLCRTFKSSCNQAISWWKKMENEKSFESLGDKYYVTTKPKASSEIFDRELEE